MLGAGGGTGAMQGLWVSSRCAGSQSMGVRRYMQGVAQGQRRGCD